MDLASILPVLLNNILLYGVLFLAVLTLIIFIHEMGHYLAARYLGVRAEVFSIGFGRELFGRTDKLGTRWSFRVFPIGGYVRMFGAYETQELRLLKSTDLQSAYYPRPVWQRSLITMAGPAINLLFGFLLLTTTYMTVGRPTPEPFISAIEVNSPAETSGMRIGDVFLSLDGRPVYTTDQVKDYVASRAGENIDVVLRRGNSQINLLAKPAVLEETNSYGFKTTRGYFGAIWPSYGLDLKEIRQVNGIDTSDNKDLARRLLIENFGHDVVIKFGKKKPDILRVPLKADANQALLDPDSKDYDVLTLGKRPLDSMQRLGVLRAGYESLVLTWRGINRTLGTFVKIFVASDEKSELGGVIKISQMTGKVAGQGAFMFLSFIAMLSINIGMVNLLPIPMLDGGHLMFYAAEAVKGEPVSLKAKGYTYGIGIVFLIIAMLAINIKDMMGLFAAH